MKDELKELQEWIRSATESYYVSSSSRLNEKIDEMIAARVEPPDLYTDDDMSNAYGAGFKLCQSAGDNWIHLNLEPRFLKWISAYAISKRTEMIEGLSPEPNTLPHECTGEITHAQGEQYQKCIHCKWGICLPPDDPCPGRMDINGLRKLLRLPALDPDPPNQSEPQEEEMCVEIPWAEKRLSGVIEDAAQWANKPWFEGAFRILAKAILDVALEQTRKEIAATGVVEYSLVGGRNFYKSTRLCLVPRTEEEKKQDGS